MRSLPQLTPLFLFWRISRPLKFRPVLLLITPNIKHLWKELNLKEWQLSIINAFHIVIFGLPFRGSHFSLSSQVILHTLWQLPHKTFISQMRKLMSVRLINFPCITQLVSESRSVSSIYILSTVVSSRICQNVSCRNCN